MSYYGFGFDPEAPAGYQDADIEMAEMAEPRRISRCEGCGHPAAYRVVHPSFTNGRTFHSTCWARKTAS